MDGHRFDRLTKRLARLMSRREGLRVLLAGAGAAGALGLPMEAVRAACGGPGTRCKNGGPCCSGFCLRDRKKGKKGRKKGRCDCSFPQEGCAADNHCCFASSTCGDNGCDPDVRCCESEAAECIDPCDCCFNFTCEFEGDQGGSDAACPACSSRIHAVPTTCVAPTAVRAATTGVRPRTSVASPPGLTVSKTATAVPTAGVVAGSTTPAAPVPP